MSGLMDGCSALRRPGRAVWLAVFAFGCGITLATAPQGQEVPKTPPKSATKAGTGDESSWIKVCTKDEKTGNKQVCLVKHEGLEPKTGAVLIAAAVRTIEGADKQHLLVNVPTAYSLVMPTGVQIKIDEGDPIQLRYLVCLPKNCQVQMELSKEILDKMRKGKQMFIAAMNAQQKTMVFPISLQGFAKTSDGPPVDNVAYQEARGQMLEAARQHQIELAKKAAGSQQIEPGAGAPPKSDGTMVPPTSPNAPSPQ